MKIAIHYYSNDFSDRWIEYCLENNIFYKRIDCYSNDIMTIMQEFDILLWSWNLGRYESLYFAKELIYALEKMGKIVFPSFNTSFLYDNKIGQKYLLEAINAPYIQTYVFYNQGVALKWANETTYPKVFKLSGGAGSINVKLCLNKQEAFKLINKSFGKGFSQSDRLSWFQDKLGKFKEEMNFVSLKNLLKSCIRLFIPTEKEKMLNKDKGYIYFQEFIPNNDYDIRVIVIDKKAFALKRICRENDFRASGSGKIEYSKHSINLDCIQVSFEVTKSINAQCMAFDFVFDENNKPLIVEMSYHFAPYAYDECDGYWTEKLDWVDGHVNPQYMIIESIIKNYNRL